MLRTRHIALLLALLLAASPVLACCGALHDLLQTDDIILVDEPSCHGDDADKMPPPETCMECPACDLSLSGTEPPTLVLIPSSKEFPALIDLSHGTNDNDTWVKSSSTTGPPADPLIPAETLIRQQQLLLI